MKARKRNSNDDWQKIAYILLKNSNFPQSADLMEFEQETTGGTKYLPNYIYDHWQDVRERAAIAAMQSLIREKYDASKGFLFSSSISVEAVEYADALVKQLKKRN